MNPSIVYVGIDVAKAKIDIHLNGEDFTLAQSPAHYEVLRQRLRPLAGHVHVICEASGGYERELVAYLHSHQILLSLVNPRQVRHLARATGKLAKTDKLDAAMLAEFGARCHPVPTVPPDAAWQQLRHWVDHRQHLVDDLTREKNYSAHLTEPKLRKLALTLQRLLQTQIEAIEDQIKVLLKEQPHLGQLVKRLCAVQGVALITAVNLLASLPELGSLSKRQAAALAGLAPINCDSGQYRGQRHIAAGRHSVRRALYMAAVCASRLNPVLTPFYQHLRARGKSFKVAITATMRKLLIVLNAVAKNQDFVLAS